MSPVTDQLERLLSVLRSVRPENRVLIVEEEVLPAITTLCGHVEDESAPRTLLRSCKTMESWARMVAYSQEDWRIYLDRLTAHVSSLRILSKVQTMGKSATPMDRS